MAQGATIELALAEDTIICPLLSIARLGFDGRVVICVKNKCQWWAKCQTIWDALEYKRG